MTSSKKALMLSITSVLVCIVMLMASTFAWFTDNVSTGANSIMTGNLDVELEYTTDFVNWNSVEDKTDLFNADARWEPGYAQVLYLRVRNNGDLAVKYRLGIDVESETSAINVKGNQFTLSQYLKYGIVEDQDEAFGSRAAAIAAVTDPKDFADDGKDGTLDAGSEPKYIAMVVYMPETVLNDANYDSSKSTAPTIDFSINLAATQNTVESDAFGADYDTAATIPVVASNIKDLTEVEGKSGSIVLANDIGYDITGYADLAEFYGNTEIDLNGKNMTLNSISNPSIFYGMSVINTGTLTINGNGTMNTADAGAYCFHVDGAFYAKGGTLIINGGNYYADTTVVNVQKGTAYINGGFFDADGSVYTINCIDTPYKNGQANIIVTGGTFVNFNPADNAAEGANTNFVADGYKVVEQTQPNGDIWYTVVKA